LSHVYNYWREIVEKVSKDYPKIEHEFNYVDAVTMWFVKTPEHYQTVVAPNMFGDIITDLGAMIQAVSASLPAATSTPKASRCSSPSTAQPRNTKA